MLRAPHSGMVWRGDDDLWKGRRTPPACQEEGCCVYWGRAKRKLINGAQVRKRGAQNSSTAGPEPCGGRLSSLETCAPAWLLSCPSEGISPCVGPIKAQGPCGTAMVAPWVCRHPQARSLAGEHGRALLQGELRQGVPFKWDLVYQEKYSW